MNALLRPITLIWLLLIAATGLSWHFGGGYDPEQVTVHPRATVAILLIALFKIRLVMRHFMEVRSAPLVLQLLTDAWLLVVGALILGLYWQGVSHAAHPVPG